MKANRIVAALLAGILTASFLVLPSLSRGFNEPMIVKVFYFFVIDDSEQEQRPADDARPPRGH